MPVSRLAYIGFSHFEADECGSLNEFLALAPNARPLCSAIAAMVSVDDVADRPALGLDDNATLSLGRHRLRSLYTPHLPHGWEANALYDETTGTLFSGDLFTQPGSVHAPLTSSDILEPSELMRGGLDYFAHSPDTGAQLERLAGLGPKTLASMHGSAYAGDGAALLRELSRRLETTRARNASPRSPSNAAELAAA
jgi:flavorubredoxin